MIAKIDMYWEGIKLEKTFGKLVNTERKRKIITSDSIIKEGYSVCYFHLLERNSRIGIATCTVSEIFDKFNNISGSSFTIVSLISRRHVISAVTHNGADLFTKPNTDKGRKRKKDKKKKKV